MHLLPRARLELARRPWLYWLFVGLCAFVVWWGIHSATAAATAERQRWGTSRTVMVATRAAAAGESITAHAADYPLAMVPASAVRSLPAHAEAAHTIAKGEVIVDSSVAGDDAVPGGWAVFAIAHTDVPALLPGDDVAVFADGTRRCDGLVTSVTTERTDVAVPPGCADALSAFVATGSVVLARSG